MIWEVLARETARLKTACIAEPELEAEVLLRHTLDMERSEFFAALSEGLTPPQVNHVTANVARRLRHEPLAYITGRREFYGLDFAVNEHVLIPRQETELLVDKALEHASEQPYLSSLTVADVGTGCGSIAIAIAVKIPSAIVYAIDTDERALGVANANRMLYGVDNRVTLLQGDLLTPLDEPVDVIVSNPPYIPTDEIDTLAEEVQREPRRALDGGSDGLAVIKRLLQQAPSYVKTNGRVLIEIGDNQSDNVVALARNSFHGSEISVHSDLSGLPRVVSISSGAPQNKC